MQANEWIVSSQTKNRKEKSKITRDKCKKLLKISQ